MVQSFLRCSFSIASASNERDHGTKGSTFYASLPFLRNNNPFSIKSLTNNNKAPFLPWDCWPGLTQWTLIFEIFSPLVPDQPGREDEHLSIFSHDGLKFQLFWDGWNKNKIIFQVSEEDKANKQRRKPEFFLENWHRHSQSAILPAWKVAHSRRGVASQCWCQWGDISCVVAVQQQEKD